MIRLDYSLATALGYDIKEYIQLPGGQGYMIAVDEEGDRLAVPLFSRDSIAAMDLDKEMAMRGFKLRIHRQKPSYVACFVKEAALRTRSGIALAETLPLAMALAAYDALTGMKYCTQAERVM